MAVSSNTLVASIEKLMGRDNYNEWKFATKAYLEHEQLWECVTGDDTDVVHNVKAKSKLVLLIHPSNFSHILSCDSAKEIWDALSTAFADSGLSRRVALMRTLTSARLEQCDGMEKYVNLIMNTVHKLRGINCNVSEDWVGTFLLAGLPDTYQPMIMAVENSGIAITGDSIKTRLLQEPNIVNSNRVHSSSALSTVGRFNNDRDRRGPRCFICNEYGHIAVQCRKQRQEDVSEAAHRTAPSNTNRQGAKSSYATGFFAGFVGQGNVNRIIDSDASASVHNRLQQKSIGHTTQSNNDYDPYRYVYVDDVFTYSSNSNLVGEEDNCAITNSNSVVTERQGSDLINLNDESNSDDWTDSDEDLGMPNAKAMESFLSDSSGFKGF